MYRDKVSACLSGDTTYGMMILAFLGGMLFFTLVMRAGDDDE